MTSRGETNRPMPRPTPLTQPFWDAAKRSALELQRCQSCGHFQHPPYATCVQCISADLKFEPVGGKGTIYAYTIMYHTGDKRFAPVVPYASIIVELDDAPHGDTMPDGFEPDDLVVHQQDVQGVVNALWAGGAEAMQIMDQRIIATSAVRCVGNTLILQGRVYSPPYTVTAIGDPERLARALEDSPNVQVFRYYVDTFGLGYQTHAATKTRLPAYDGSLDLLHARATG